MTMVKTVRDAALALAVLMMCVLPAFSQTSIGFEDPKNISNLLEYRLPDWGYRTWDLDFDLGGNGTDYYRGDDNRQIQNSVYSQLSTVFLLFRESEARTWQVNGSADGSYRRDHRGLADQEISSHNLRGGLGLGGYWWEYLGEGPFFLRANGAAGRSYDEYVEERRSGGETLESGRFARAGYLNGGLGAGVGRVRDVTPLIRAQRMSERLEALDRAPLSPDQVQQVAAVLATEQGYRTVFDRPDRSFWRDVLEPMLDEARPLSPYEIFYLRDALTEDIGTRSQGTRLSVIVSYNEFRDDVKDVEFLSVRRYGSISLGWYRNLSLNHQVSAQGSLGLSRVSARDDRDDFVDGDVYLRYLWTIADRYRWDNTARFVTDYAERQDVDARLITREFRTELGSTFRIFVEDNMAVKASIRASNRQRYDIVQIDDELEIYGRGWTWSYGIGLEYYLDRFLY